MIKFLILMLLAGSVQAIEIPEWALHEDGHINVSQILWPDRKVETETDYYWCYDYEQWVYKIDKDKWNSYGSSHMYDLTTRPLVGTELLEAQVTCGWQQTCHQPSE